MTNPPTASNPTFTAAEVRAQFIDYFIKKQNHRFVKSSPVVPHDDPTLLFANAGMNQFKPYFLGTEKPSEDVSTRVANTQKCIRAGGKHNDLDDVGKDTYHHTFFEMLGNWSFGDYFKKEAIDWAWELLTVEWGIDSERLYATYFEGDASEGLEPDTEAKELWGQYLPDERILPGNKKDNFWEMGDTGPCGPCSELHYDGRPTEAIAKVAGGELVNQDDPDVIEIWNLVFIQFNRNTDSSLAQLPAKHVDTGMGFERIVRVLQGKDSNYDTDVFTPIFEAIQQITGSRPYGGILDDKIDTAYRIIADHIRTLTFALTDGAVPSNDGRGYVLRRILRRAVLQGWQTLNVKEPFFYKLVEPLVDHMGDAFPELRNDPCAVADLIQEEEVSFIKTIDRGINLFEDAVQRGGNRITADDAFQLYDTFGFPLDLMQVMGEDRGITVDVPGFEERMAEAKERSRAVGGEANVRASLVELVQKEALSDTEFVGYDTTEFADETMQIRVYPSNGSAYGSAAAKAGDEVAVVLDRTPFYAESGGQVGDQGVLQFNGCRVDVMDTTKLGNVWFHLGTLADGQTPAGVFEANVSAAVDSVRRAKIQANHTSTHLLNQALRHHVNEDAAQKGSLVDNEKLRFDFSNSKAVSVEQLNQVEQFVNDEISKDLVVHTGIAPQEEATQINGLRAVFGEKYPPKVRVVSVGAKVDDLLANPSSADWANLSIEFCGGTHLAKTGDAEGFAIIGEEAVAKGVRRITALTGATAHKATAEAEALLNRMESLKSASAEDLNTKLDELVRAYEQQTTPLALKAKIQSTLNELAAKHKAMQKEAGSKQTEAVVETARQIADEAESTGESIVVARLDGADGKSIRSAMDVIRKCLPEAAMFLATAEEETGKVALLASVTKTQIESGLKAGDWVKQIAPIVGGGGGGRPDMAQAGGKDPSKIDEALEAAKLYAKDRL